MGARNARTSCRRRCTRHHTLRVQADGLAIVPGLVRLVAGLLEVLPRKTDNARNQGNRRQLKKQYSPGGEARPCFISVVLRKRNTILSEVSRGVKNIKPFKSPGCVPAYPSRARHSLQSSLRRPYRPSRWCDPRSSSEPARLVQRRSSSSNIAAPSRCFLPQSAFMASQNFQFILRVLNTNVDGRRSESESCA